MGIKHGMSKTKEWRIWSAIKERCYNENRKDYNRYGGRGIKICERWLNSFPNFLEDMGLRPSDKHSIDRIDVNGNYCPENCKWSTDIEQANNRRNTIRIEYNGEIKTLSEWSKIYNIKISILRKRLSSGWPAYEIFNKPISGPKMIEYNGQIHNISQWAKIYGLEIKTLQCRLKNGWSIEEALTTPTIEKFRNENSLCR